MIESAYQYEFEAEKNQDANSGFKPFDTLSEALNYIDEGGALRATCNPKIKDRIHTRTVYLTYEKIAGLRQEEIIKHLDQEVEKSLIESMGVNYGNIKELSLADLIALEGWLDQRKEELVKSSKALPADAAGNSQNPEEATFKHELTAKIRDAINSEISNRVTKIFPKYE